jgi:hypothetical protein
MNIIRREYGEEKMGLNVLCSTKVIHYTALHRAFMNLREDSPM